MGSMGNMGSMGSMGSGGGGGNAGGGGASMSGFDDEAPLLEVSKAYFLPTLVLFHG
jgi:hypothetical protein